MTANKSYFSLRFIINPTAGSTNKSKDVSSAIKKAFGDRPGIFEIKTTKNAAETAELALDAKKRGFFGVVACGGDSTVKEAAGELVGSKLALGIIPLGSANIIAGGLGIPTEIEQALRLVADATPRAIDVGKISGRYFFTSAGLGFDVVLSKKFRQWRIKKKRQIFLKYLSSELIKFKFFKFERIVMKNDGKTDSLSPFLVRFANIDRYGSELLIMPDARPDDGLLDVVVMPQVEFKEALKLMPSVIEGKLASIENTRKLRSEGPITIDRDSPGPVHVDGEVFKGDKHITVELIPKALNLWHMK